MTNHYLSLLKLTEELKCLVGSKLVECFTQEKGTLVLCFYNGESLQYLQFNTQPQIVSLFLRKNFSRAGKNTVDLFSKAIGETVQDVKIAEKDRIITFELLNYNFSFVLFGASRTNLYLINKSGIIADSFKNASKNIGKVFTIGEETKEMQSHDELNLFDWLSKLNNNLGKIYSQEFIKRYNYKTDMKLKPNSEILKQILNNLGEFKNLILNSNRFYIYKVSNKYILSLIELQTQNSDYKTFDSISKAIEYKVINTLKDRQFAKLFQKFEALIRRSLDKVYKNLEKIQKAEELRNKADKYKLWGDLLLSQKDLKITEIDEIKINDWEGNSITIPLKKELSLKENALNYYEKAKKLKENVSEMQKLEPKLNEKKEWLEKCYNQLKKASDLKVLKEVIAKINMDNKDLEQVDSQGTKFRMFDLGEGYILYVGKNARNNDELTMKFAKPNDLWFHTRGVEGSHSVLKSNKKEKVPKHIIEKSAQITAYYSKARNSKYTPVCYTLKKYVHKPKGANAGAVVVSREEVIMVEPKLEI